MNCTEMMARLDGIPGDPGDRAFTPAESEHLASCRDCRGEAQRREELGRRISAAGRVTAPDGAYWGTILPRVHARISRRAAADRIVEFFGPGRVLAQAAGLAAAVIFLLAVRVTDPNPPVRGLSIAALSDSELLDLRTSATYTGLLDHSTDPGTGVTSTVADFLAELAAGDDGVELYAAVDPVALLGEVDDDSFGRIVDIMTSDK